MVAPHRRLKSALRGCEDIGRFDSLRESHLIRRGPTVNHRNRDTRLRFRRTEALSAASGGCRCQVVPPDRLRSTAPASAIPSRLSPLSGIRPRIHVKPAKFHPAEVDPFRWHGYFRCLGYVDIRHRAATRSAWLAATCCLTTSEFSISVVVVLITWATAGSRIFRASPILPL